MSKLLSVNVGLPRDVEWQGRTVHTGVFKEPVAGSRTVRRLNIDGDGQGDLGGHGGEQRAVLVYQLESYDYWSEILHRDDLRPGNFGENFTVQGLSDDDVCIGDRYRVGEVLLEVTQPRVTCYRVGLRLGEPRMAALLVSHRRPGFYCRVVEEGEVQPGQDIVKTAAGPEQVSVAEIDALLYLPGHPRDLLERALRIPALSPGWKASLRALEQDGAADQLAGGNPGLSSIAQNGPPAWPGFRALEVTKLRRESRDVLSLTLADTTGDGLPGWLPGQSITLRMKPDGGSPLVRSYSLSNEPGSPEFRIGVKHEINGKAGDFLHNHLHAGDLLEVAAPRGEFTLGGQDTPVALLSAGIGVTPLLSMLHALVQQRVTREVWWIHGARDGAEHSFAEEARTLLSRLPGSHRYVTYSRPGPGDRRGVDYDNVGRLTADSVLGLGLPAEAEVYVCGPNRFMSDMSSALSSLGTDPGHIHMETFGAGAALTPGIAAPGAVTPHLPTGMAGTGPAVSFARSALTAAWSSRFGSLLEFAEACDVPTRWSCRTGVCHTCETALLSGEVSYDPEPLEPPADGDVLLCCARPTGDLVLDL
ncbi:MAG: MOSC and FAD-binding oxidoreductase domain-containing protein [Mycobacterium sp.]